MKLVDHFETILNRYLESFVNKEEIISERKQAYAKNIAGVSLVAVFSVPFFAILYSCIGLNIGAAGIMTGGAGILVSPYVLKSTRNLLLARAMILASLYFIFLVICFSTQGIESACTYWLLSIPVAAVFMGGIMPGIFWAAIVSATIVLMHVYEINGGKYMNQATDHRLLLETSSIVGLICVVTSLAILFESSKNQSYSKVKNSKTKLERTTGELSVLIKMISSSLMHTKKETGVIAEKAEVMAKAMKNQEILLESATQSMKDIAKHTFNNSGNAGIAKKEAMQAGELSCECEEILRQLLRKMIDVSDYSESIIDCLNKDQYITAIPMPDDDQDACMDKITEKIAKISILSGQGKTEALKAKPTLSELLSLSRKVARLVSQVYLNSRQQALSNEIAASNISSIKDSAKEISASSVEIAKSVKNLDDSVKSLEGFIASIEDRP